MSTDGTRRSFTVAEAAAYLGLTPQRVYALVERRAIAHIAVWGHHPRRLKSGKTATVTRGIAFYQEHLDAWIAANTVPVKAEAPPVARAATVTALPLPRVRRFS